MQSQIYKLVMFGSFIFASFALQGCSGESALLAKGQAIFDANCKVCHNQGINGAPIIGNKKMWSKRLPQGEDVLVQHAMTGYGLMPAKGGNSDLTEEEVRFAIKFMVSKVQ